MGDALFEGVKWARPSLQEMEWSEIRTGTRRLLLHLVRATHYPCRKAGKRLLPAVLKSTTEKRNAATFSRPHGKVDNLVFDKPFNPGVFVMTTATLVGLDLFRVKRFTYS